MWISVTSFLDVTMVPCHNARTSYNTNYNTHLNEDTYLNDDLQLLESWAKYLVLEELSRSASVKGMDR